MITTEQKKTKNPKLTQEIKPQPPVSMLDTLETTTLRKTLSL